MKNLWKKSSAEFDCCCLRSDQGPCDPPECQRTACASKHPSGGAVRLLNLPDAESHMTPLEDPREVLLESQRLIRELQRPEPSKLTVGDLSVASREKKARDAAWRGKRANMGGRATVGDLTGPDDQRGLDELYAGKKPPGPNVAPDQEILLEMQRKQRRRREAEFLRGGYYVHSGSSAPGVASV